MKDRRSHIIDAAAAVMARQGFQQTSVEDVIREAGLCGKGHFYHYFKSKEELGCAVLRHQFEQFAELGLTVLRDPLLPPLDRLSRFVDWIVRRAEERGAEGKGTPVGALASEMSQYDEFRCHVDALFERWTGQVQALLWEAKPLFQDGVDTERLARFIVATLEGALMMSRVKRDAAVLRAVASDLERYIASQVRAPEAPARGNGATTTAALGISGGEAV